ncbi:hypothetical protein BC567DRAFT_216373 [Phyllosticta citribraziliensis]
MEPFHSEFQSDCKRADVDSEFESKDGVLQRIRSSGACAPISFPWPPLAPTPCDLQPGR